MEAIIFVGIQGSGKSTFFRERFFDTHVRISLDMLRTRHRERLLLRACLEGKQPFVVDNTNPTAAERGHYIAPALAAGFTVVGYFFDAEVKDALRRNAARAGGRVIPPPGVYGTRKRLERPSRREGFARLYRVRIDPEDRFIVDELWEEPAPPAAQGAAAGGDVSWRGVPEADILPPRRATRARPR